MSMISRIKKIVQWGTVLFVLVFVLFAVNQLIDLYANLVTVDQRLAIGVTAVLGVVFVILFLLPFILYWKLPASLQPDFSNEVEYKVKLQKRLSKNKRVKAARLNTFDEADFIKALALLDYEAQQVIQRTATSVFLTTAVSQNGKLDALTVLVTQSRMVWKVAHIYWQRPGLRDMVNLYANVGAAGLIASEIEDVDISRQVEPIISALLKSPGRSLPVIGHATHIITDSLLEGSTNAFLTLRVGVITKKYCGHPQDIADIGALKKSAFIEASGMLKKLVIQSSGKVISSVMQAVKDAGKNTLKSGTDAIGKAADNLKNKVVDFVQGKKEKDKKELLH